MIDPVAFRLVLLIFLLTLVCYSAVRQAPRNVQIIVFGALFARFLATAFVNAFPVIPYTRDYPKYNSAIQTIVGGWHEGVLFSISPFGVVKTYSYLMAPFYAVAPTTVTVELVNGLLGALVVFNVYRITKRLHTRSWALVPTLLVAAYPSFIHYTSILMRDALIIFLISELVYLLVKWITIGKTPWLSIIVVAFLVFLRPENLAFLLPTITVAVLLKNDIRLSSLQTISVSGVLFIGGSIIVAIMRRLLPEEIPTPSPEALSARRTWLARDSGEISGNYLSSVTFDSWGDVIVFAPIGAVYFLLVPFPWMIDLSNPFMIIALIENIFLLYPAVIVLLARLRYPTTLSQAEVLLLVTLLFGITSYGLVEGNMGPAMRHRLQFTFLIFILAAPKFPLITPFPVTSADGTANPANE